MAQTEVIRLHTNGLSVRFWNPQGAARYRRIYFEDIVNPEELEVTSTATDFSEYDFSSFETIRTLEIHSTQIDLDAAWLPRIGVRTVKLGYGTDFLGGFKHPWDLVTRLNWEMEETPRFDIETYFPSLRKLRCEEDSFLWYVPRNIVKVRTHLGTSPRIALNFLRTHPHCEYIRLNNAESLNNRVEERTDYQFLLRIMAEFPHFHIHLPNHLLTTRTMNMLALPDALEISSDEGGGEVTMRDNDSLVASDNPDSD